MKLPQYTELSLLGAKPTASQPVWQHMKLRVTVKRRSWSDCSPELLCSMYLITSFSYRIILLILVYRPFRVCTFSKSSTYMIPFWSLRVTCNVEARKLVDVQRRRPILAKYSLSPSTGNNSYGESTGKTFSKVPLSDSIICLKYSNRIFCYCY